MHGGLYGVIQVHWGLFHWLGGEQRASVDVESEIMRDNETGGGVVPQNTKWVVG